MYPKQKNKSKIMAQKDPAFLFYSQDFYVGTAFLTHTQVGKYIRLICAQHQHGRLNEERVIQICGDLDEAVLEKFQKDENGFYYNVRLETEIEKRKRFSESRRNNIKKRWDSSVIEVNKTSKTSELHLTNTSNTSEYTSELHMNNTSNTYGDTSVIHMENENENRNISLESSNNSEKENSKRKRKTFIPPTVEEVIEFVVSKGFDQQLGRNAWEYYAVADWKDAKGDQVLNWKQKLLAGWLKNAQKGVKIQLSNENDVNIPGYIKEFHNSPLMKREVINGRWEYKSAPIGFKS